MATIIERRKRGEKIYAFNIDQKNSEKHAHKNINFDKINKGFYDELLDCHDKIKSDIIKLAKSKTKSFKESVYSNKKIPDTWMNKESYYSELYGTMDKDKFFVSYLGKGNEIEEKDLKKSYDFKKKYKLEKLEDFESKDFLVKTFGNLNNKVNKSIGINKKIHPLRQFIMTKKKKNEINDILEEYEKKYPINLPSIIVRKEPTLNHGLNDFLLEEEKFEKKEKKEENENENEIIHNNNFITGNLNNENNENNDNKNLENNNNELNINTNENNENKEIQEGTNSILSQSLTKNEMKKKPEQEKKDVFKTTLFNNMLPYRDNKIKYNNKPLVKMDINNFESPFLHSTTAEFNQIIEITNPKINEKLSSIQYWGPYFSHCPPCRNKSLNFYQSMETNQCLTLLDYIRKVRNSKNFLK